MMADELLNAQDLITAKKHDTFHSEVITGKAGGVAGGATIGTATNPVTGQTQQTLPSILADLGFDVQSWTSSTGGVLAYASQVFLNDTSGSLGLGDYYAWGGTFPKTVPAGTDPALPTSGYIMRSSRFAGTQSREALRRSYAETGLNLVDGSFEAGGTLVNTNDVLLQLRTGKAFSGLAGAVAAGTNPASGGFVDRSADLYSNNGLTMAGRYSTLAAAVSAAMFGAVQVNTGVTKAKDLILFDTGLVGNGVGSIVQADAGATAAIILSGGIGDTDWQYKQLANITVDGNNRLSNAIEFGGLSNPTLAGRWHLDNVHATNANIGILKRHGNIGNVYTALNVTKCDIGYSGQPGADMPSGCDLFYGGELSVCDSAAMYYYSTRSDSGQIVLNGTVFEGNAGFGLFIKRFAGAYLPVVLNDVWFEQNATAASVTIEGVSYTPKDIRIDGCSHVEINRSSIRKVEFNNSRVIIDGCLLNDSSQITFDKQCTLMARNMRIFGGYYPFVIESVVLVPDIPGQLVSTWRCPHRIITNNTENVILGETFANASSYSFAGSSSVTGKKVSDGLIYDTCCEVVVPDGGFLRYAGGVFLIPNSKWTVFTLDIKCVTGNISQAAVKLKIANANKSVHNFNKIMEVGKWTSVAVIIQSTEDLIDGRIELALNPGDGPATFRLSAMQAVRFDTPDEAHAFYNSREYRGGASTSPVMTYGTEAPTTGTWARGDQVINANPTTGLPKGWTCIVSGAPGTWASQGNL